MNPVLVRALRDGAIFSAAVAIIAGLIGLLVAGLPGLFAGLLGAVLSFVYLGLTAASMLAAAHLTREDPGSPLYFGIVLGTWALKLIIFIVFAIWLRTQTWLDPVVFFVTVIVAVVGSLVLDVIAFQRSRQPYVDVELPGESKSPQGPKDGVS